MPRAVSADPCVDRLALCTGNLLFRRTADGGGIGGDALPDDPGSRSGVVFTRVPPQQLDRRDGFCRPGGEFPVPESVLRVVVRPCCAYSDTSSYKSNSP